MDMTLRIFQKDSAVIADRWLVPQAATAAPPDSPVVSLVGLAQVQLMPGEYQVKVLGRDRFNPQRSDSVILRVPVHAFPPTGPALSDIEFASSIRMNPPTQGQFYKNTLEVVPNVGGVFTEGQRCFYYAEAYNLVRGTDTIDYVLRTTVFDAVGREVLSREKPKRRPGESSVIADQFGVGRFKTGTYTLVLALLDTAGKSIATSGKKFFVYNSQLGVDSSLLSASADLPLNIYMAMGEAELDQEFRWLRYEATDRERDNYQQLSGADAKRKFLSDFWRTRPPGRRDEYLARVAAANQTMRSGGKEGYRTDRGRVLIMYGTPDDVDRHPNEIDSRPYEIWSYNNIQGGVIFVFVQRTAGAEYELVHSTHRNELRDDNWDREGITR
jgi:GWxTD domain-containing protein